MLVLNAYPLQPETKNRPVWSSGISTDEMCGMVEMGTIYL